jgi:hypothetical protein
MTLLDKAKQFLEQKLEDGCNMVTKLPKAIIMDVDDTLVKTGPQFKLIKVKNHTIFIYPGIKEMIDVAKKAHQLKYTIIILTARPKSSFLSTKFNLDLLGVPYKEIYMNNKNLPITFKYHVRKQLMTKYSILFTVGDQIPDVAGPPGLLGIKLPSKESNKVYIYSN